MGALKARLMHFGGRVKYPSAVSMTRAFSAPVVGCVCPGLKHQAIMMHAPWR